MRGLPASLSQQATPGPSMEVPRHQDGTNAASEGSSKQTGRESMANKSAFTSDEWKTLLESVMAAGLAVTAAEPSGLWGLLKESFASGTLLAKTKMDTGSNPLIKAVVDDFATSEGRATSRDGLKEKLGERKPAEIKTACIEILGKVDGILSAKAPGDADPFKNWLAKSVKASPRHPPRVAFWA